MRPVVEVADIFQQYGDAYRQTHRQALSQAQHRVMSALACCRTAVLGGHIEECEQCGERRQAYNSCRNRHCPKCQAFAKAQWVEARQADLLPVGYFHVVFTLPAAIAAIAHQNQAVVYGLLFQTAAETLRTIAGDPKHLGAEIGCIAILHTWGQTLSYHPHLHCAIPGGGLAPDGERWVGCRPGFFLPVRVLSQLFRRLFLTALQRAFERNRLQFFGALADLAEPEAFAQYLAPLRKTKWVVYAKRPFGGVKQVLDYVGRYTHRIAIANQRLISLEDGAVTFHWKDYRHHHKQKRMTLKVEEFIRRFLLHVLPPGFQRIRHYGLLGNRYRRAKLARCRQVLGVLPALPVADSPPMDYRTRYEQLTGRSLDRCPVCQQGRMVRVAVIPVSTRPRGVIWRDSS